MDKPTAYLTLSRHKSSANRLRQFNIMLDNRVVGTIKAGQTKQFRVSSGAHSVCVKLDLYKSRPLAITLRPAENLALVCGEHAPENLNEAFSLKGLEKSLNSVIKPGQYLYVKAADSQPVQTAVREPCATAAVTTASSGRSRTTARGSLFISYRREDSREITGRICDRLNAEFGRETVFRDIDSIPAGVDFREHIKTTIGGCQVLIAIIGDRWLTAVNAKGEQRLEQTDDPLRLEIETALKAQIPVIPVLVKNASMPTGEQLPHSLQDLAYRNAIIIPSEPYFHYGVDRLIEELGKSLTVKPSGDRQASSKFCIHCGNDLLPGNRFCIQCGHPIAEGR